MRTPNFNIKVINDTRDFRTSDRFGISLHCHSRHSKEALDFIPYYARQFPIVSWLYERESKNYERANGRPPNFTLGYWEPPLTGRQVFESESEAIEDLGLASIISITDHDSIQAHLEITDLVDTGRAPISLEWTVPFGKAYFHIGIHNLPPDRAGFLTGVLLDYTFAADAPDTPRLCDILRLLTEIPELLVVLNHPFWDIEVIGQAAHDENLKAFMIEYAAYVHAIELNGFRPWSENKRAIRLAEELAIPLISGGDRHCRCANTMINTSRAGTFAQFVEEVRIDKLSNILVLPEYRRPLVYRQVRSISHVLANYPEFPESRRHWSQRVYFDGEDGNGGIQLSERWSGKPPAFYRFMVGTMSSLAHPSLIPVFAFLSETDLPDEMTQPKHTPSHLVTNSWYKRLRSMSYKKSRFAE